MINMPNYPLPCYECWDSQSRSSTIVASTKYKAACVTGLWFSFHYYTNSMQNTGWFATTCTNSAGWYSSIKQILLYGKTGSQFNYLVITAGCFNANKPEFLCTIFSTDILCFLLKLISPQWLLERITACFQSTYHVVIRNVDDGIHCSQCIAT